MGNAKIFFDDRCYDSKTKYDELEYVPFKFVHKPLGWVVNMGFN